MAVFASRQIVLPKMVNYVNFIQSSGTQYIKTGIYPTQNHRVECDIELTSFGLSVLFGHYLSGSNQFAAICLNGGATWRAWFGSAATDFSGDCTGRHQITFSKTAMTTSSGSVSYSGTAFTSSIEMYIFGLSSGSSATFEYPASMKLYNFKIYECDTLLRDFWPCYDPDGVACLYDKVEKKYYYNAGTGEFIAGEAA